MTDIIIIGAGCAGMTAALYAARAGKSVLVLEQETIGGQIASSPRVENYPGVSAVSGLEFSDRLYAQAEAQGVSFDLARVTGIRPGSPAAVLTESGDRLCRSIILASGVRHRTLGLPEEERLTGHGVSYCAVCDGAFYKNRDVAVVGGGSAALQSAEYLCGICRSVTLIHRRDTFRGESALAARVTKLPGLRLALGSVVTALEGTDALTGVTLCSGETETQLPVSGLFVMAGQQAQNAPFAAQLALDADGYVAAGEDCCTDVPGVFAAGDCRHKQIRQLTTAAADGAVAALAACRWIDAQK